MTNLMARPIPTAWFDGKPYVPESYVVELLAALQAGAQPMTLEDAFNSRFQDLLYALIDSKADGLRDCTVTEIVEVAATAFTEAGKDVLEGSDQ